MAVLVYTVYSKRPEGCGLEVKVGLPPPCAADFCVEYSTYGFSFSLSYDSFLLGTTLL